MKIKTYKTICQIAIFIMTITILTTGCVDNNHPWSYTEPTEVNYTSTDIKIEQSAPVLIDKLCCIYKTGSDGVKSNVFTKISEPVIEFNVHHVGDISLSIDAMNDHEQIESIILSIKEGKHTKKYQYDLIQGPNHIDVIIFIDRDDQVQVKSISRVLKGIDTL